MVDDASGMSLDEYVRETLLAIVGGVLEAQADEKCGAYIGRAPAKVESLAVTKDVHDNVVTLVNFDLATTVESKSGKSGGIGIKVVPMLNLGAEAKAEASASSISRIAFSLSISIPKPDAQRADDKARQERRSQAIREANARLAR